MTRVTTAVVYSCNYEAFNGLLNAANAVFTPAGKRFQVPMNGLGATVALTFRYTGYENNCVVFRKLHLTSV
jgi:hypothetical protein